MVQDNLEVAVVASLVHKAVLNLDIVVVSGGEKVVAHGGSRVLVQNNVFVLPLNIGVGSNGKASIFINGARDKVGKCFIKGAAELDFACKGWLEKNRAFAICIELADVAGGSSDSIASVSVHLSNVHNTVAPGTQAI